MNNAYPWSGLNSTLPDAFALLARWNYSLAAFYVRRFQRQMELPLRMAQVASPADLVEVRRAFEADLVTDYADQAAALHQACSEPTDTLDSGIPGSDAEYAAQLLKAQQHAAALIEQAKTQAERIVAHARARAAEIAAAAETAARTPPHHTAAG